MENHELQSRLQAAGMARAQIEMVLKNLVAQNPIPVITCQAEYQTTKETYVLMDSCLPPKDMHSAAARYVITLGARMLEWEAKKARSAHHHDLVRQKKASRKEAKTS